MKLVIGGSSGFLGTELVRQALANPAITSIVGLSRRETPIPPGSVDEQQKLISLVCYDFESYSDDIKKRLEDADACIWTIGPTLSKSSSMTWEQIVKVCRDHTATAVETMATVPHKQNTPLRFIYMSGHFVFRKPEDNIMPSSVGPWKSDNQALLDLLLLRGQTETLVLDYAEQHSNTIESAVARSGLITVPEKISPSVPGLPTIDLQEIAAALLDQVISGFEKDTLLNDDLLRIGRKALAK